MEHSFDIEVAADVGVNAAVIFKNFCFWIEHNEKNGSNFRDGKYWVYNTNNALQELFPYLTKSQIHTAICKLRENNYLDTGNYNKFGCDRTLWYSLGDVGMAFIKNQKSILQKSKMEITKIENDISENSNANTKYKKDALTDNNNPPYIPPSGDNTSEITSSKTDTTKEIRSELKHRVNALFSRKDNTTWSDKETAKLQQIARRNGVLDECTEIERLYNSDYPYRRRSVSTFLNNWTEELDRARNYKPQDHVNRYDCTTREVNYEPSF